MANIEAQKNLIDKEKDGIKQELSNLKNEVSDNPNEGYWNWFFLISYQLKRALVSTF